MYAVKPVNLQVPDQPGLPPLHDEWNITVVSKMKTAGLFRRVPGALKRQRRRSSLFKSTKAETTKCYFSHSYWTFGQTRKIEVRFEIFLLVNSICSGSVSQARPMAHVHGQSRSYCAGCDRAAPQQEQKPLFLESMDFLERFARIEPLKAFCFRYMLEKCDAYRAMRIVYNEAQSKKEESL
jgi:hypothetical protein